MTDLPVSHLIYYAAGSPPSDAWSGDVDGDCRLCGASGRRGRAWDEWVRDTFTDNDRVHPGSIVCTACLFCSQERTQMWLAHLLGKEKGQRFRNYSHFVLRGRWHCLTKSEKRRMRELLMQEPEVAVIADSGQRHLVFRARPGWWQFELRPPIRPDPALLAWMLGVTEALYAAGAFKAEIESGRYDMDSIRRIGAETWCDLEHRSGIRRVRGTPMFGLAIFLAQKPEEHDDQERVHRPGGGQRALI